MDKYILALDQGTTSSRAILFNEKGKIYSSAQEEFTQFYPNPGWVEHDPFEIWSKQVGVAIDAINKKGLNSNNIEAIGITNQRETVMVWDRHTGQPIYNAIVWQDKRTSDYCNQLKAEGKEGMIQEKTGLVIDSYFSATKVKWILDNVDGAREKANAGDLILGTIDSWLIWNFTKGELHITDVSNASRTMLFNINTLEWDEDLLALFDIPMSMLPKIKDSSAVYGHTRNNEFASNIPISGIGGDQMAALFGQMCTTKGMVKSTYGTGCFMLMNIGEEPIMSNNKLLTTVAWRINGKTNYALEGSVFIGGAIVQWLRDGLRLIKHSSDIEQLAKSVNSSDGVYLIPAFAGMGAPYWNQEARGTIFGITRGTTDAHIARAALDAIAYQAMDILKAMQKDAKMEIKELRVDGGASINNMLMQFQSDVLDTMTIRPKTIETTALGAAYLAGLAVGYWKDINQIQEIWQEERKFYPTKDQETVQKGINGWYKAVKALEYWTQS